MFSVAPDIDFFEIRPQRRCKRCLAELGPELAELAQEIVNGTNVCPTHLATMPPALLEALEEDVLDPKLVERESARQWTIATGRPVYLGERVDALGFLRRHL